MIDWHSHILPGMDDGSKNVEESLRLLDMLSAQEVDTVAATPHFYADDERLDSFLSRRAHAAEKLRSALPENAPTVLCGSEVRFYPGISKLEGLETLCLEGTRLLLLEMPFCTWTEYTLRELLEMASGRTRIVLAHIDRYHQPAKTWHRLAESGILMQANASYFTTFGTRHKALTAVYRGEVRFIGSDCHNTANRPPRIGEAFAALRKKYGDEFLFDFHRYGQSLLKKA